MTKQELIDGVKAHALANYETGGWDYLVEAYEDNEVAKLIAGETTLEGAIARVAEVMEILDDRRSDIQGWAF